MNIKENEKYNKKESKIIERKLFFKKDKMIKE